MRFKINEIGVEGVALDIPLTADWLREACPELDTRPAAGGLRLAGRLAKSGDDYLLRADITGQLETPCARCLEPASVTMRTPLVVTYVPFEETGNDDETEDDDPDVVVFSGGDIDLSDAVRDEIVLALPMNPLCTESCRGLCPVCGGNRNQVACTCEIDRAAPATRMAALAKVKL
jgi:uncharacterized protein